MKYFKTIINKFVRKTSYNYDTYRFVKNNQIASTNILTDDIESDPISPNQDFSFENYSNAIVSIINGPGQKFCVGIYGEWGTGKTTLMKLVEKKLKPHVFYWENIPGEDSDKLKVFLKKNFEGLYWLDNPNLQLKKNNNKNTLEIYDNTSANYLSIVLKETTNKATLEINHDIVYDFFVTKEENKKENKENISIEENNNLTVWFNAWRYEREDQFALVPLMKTIAFAMGNHPHYKNLKPILLRGIRIVGEDILRNLVTRYIMSEDDAKEFEQKLMRKIEQLPEIDKNTIYFDGVKTLECEIKKILKENEESRIVVFIDDLDRCSPETTLQVFESVKAFLDIDGFIFVMGVSRETLDKLITKKYEQMGLSGITGDLYLRKIIQIPINILEWKETGIRNLITELSKKLNDGELENNKEIIVKGVEMNPRQVKRLINRHIITRSAHPPSLVNPFDPKNSLISDILDDRWPLFYQFLKAADDKQAQDANFKEIENYINKQPKDRQTFIQGLESRENEKEHKPLKDFEKIILLYKKDSALWNFIELTKDTLPDVVKDKRYKQASESTNLPYPYASMEAIGRQQMAQREQIQKDSRAAVVETIERDPTFDEIING